MSPKCVLSGIFAQKGSIQHVKHRKRLYTLNWFAMMRSALERCVGKTPLKPNP
ncbi:hypothetical protein FORC37_0899 [Vibrio vulnificus]|nr:hypothetical protein FORC9_1924 [Vibrio vulnificus]ANH62758.1 hypothetical protein FORC16_0875 [Vibrio vulnificus]ASC56593.1 hypothetical protein FORC37_0899 [Vibrio vulnificus]